MCQGNVKIQNLACIQDFIRGEQQQNTFVSLSRLDPGATQNRAKTLLVRANVFRTRSKYKIFSRRDLKYKIFSEQDLKIYNLFRTRSKNIKSFHDKIQIALNI